MMAAPGRNKTGSLCLVLFFAAVLTLLPMLCGCGGSGSGGSVAGLAPTGSGIITGRVIAPDDLLLRLNLAAAASDRSVARAMVWLESRPDRIVLTDATGRYSLSDVPYGSSQRVVSRFDLPATGEIYLTRSAEIVVESQSAAEVAELMLEKGQYSIAGVLRDQFGQAVANARLSVWGIQFKSGADGSFVTPPLPDSVRIEKLSITAAGFRPLELSLPFLRSADTSTAIDITLSDNSEPNFAPVVYFTAAPASVNPGEKIQLTAAVIDPDELAVSSFQPLWTAFSGNIENTADPFTIFWTAPSTTGLATVSVSLADSHGAPGTAGIGIAVGGDRKPVVRIDRLTPDSGPAGSRVTISGSGFGSDKDAISISFNGKEAVVFSCNDAEIVTEIPSGATTGLLLISKNGEDKSAGVFVVLDAGMSISPGYGPPGTIVELSGSDFGSDQAAGSVFVNGREAEIVFWSNTLIRFIAPENASGGVVSLLLRGRELTAGLFKVTRVFGISSENVTAGSVITITGEGWGNARAASDLKFSADISAPIISWSDERVVFSVPAAAISGDLTAFVSGAVMRVATMRVVSIDQVTPARGIAGDEMTVAGHGFGDQQGAGYACIGATKLQILSWSDQAIRVKIPAEARPGRLQVFAHNILSNGFSVVITAITSVDYRRRPAGSSLTIEGFGFGDDSGFVLFDDAVSTVFSVWRDDRIVVEIPETATGSVALSVSNMGVRSQPFDFDVTWVEDLDLSEGWPGREIVISGNNFGQGAAGDKVTIGGVVAPVISWTNSEIRFRVPFKTVSGPLVLTISNWPIELESEFTVYNSYEYSALIPDWSGPRRNSRPLLPGLAIDAEGNTYVSDFDNGWIWKISPDGEQSKFGNLDKPWGVAISPVDGRIYVAESGKHRLQIFTATGDFVTTLGVPGSGDIEFSVPRGLTFDSYGRLYVADSGNSRIQVIAADGQSLLSEFGSYGNAAGQFIRPSAVAVDDSLTLYVADAGNDRIQRFTPDNPDSPVIWGGAGWLGSADPNTATPGWLFAGSALPSAAAGGFRSPYGVGIAGEFLLVADTNNSRLQLFDLTSGEFVRQIGVAGTTAGQYNQPLAVVFADGIIHAADSSNARVQCSTTAGEYIGQIIPDTSLLNTRPARVVVDSVRRRVYVLDADDGSITVFDFNGQAVQIIGSQGAGNGQFYRPEGLAVDSDGYLIVADTGNARIQIISPQGTFVTAWGVYGNGAGQFVRPNAIAVSADGEYIFVTDSGLHRVQKFSRNGAFIKSWGGYGSSDEGFNVPSGIAADAAGFLYVADQNNHRIKKYTQAGDFVGWWGSYDAGAQAFWLDPGSQRSGAVSDADGGFDSPTDVAVDGDGNVFVTDSGNFRVQRFASDQAAAPAAAFAGEIYIGENLYALSIDDWSLVYVLSENGTVMRFVPEP